MKIRLEIGTLVLEGFDYHDHKRVVSAMERELSRLLREGGLPERFKDGREHNISSTAAPSFVVPADRNPRRIGVEVARSIYRSVKSE